MAYTINHYNGTYLGTVADGTINNLTSLNLIGHDYTNYGTAVDENFLYLTENFAAVTAPLNPVTGQLWYNSATNALNFFNGAIFKPVATTISASAPTINALGDEWFDTSNQQLKAWNGTQWVLIGPTWPVGAGTTGFTTGYAGTNYFANINAHGNLVAIVSSNQIGSNQVGGFGNIRPGVNFATTSVANVAPAGIYNVSSITVGPTDQLLLYTDGSNNGVIQTVNNLLLNNGLMVSGNISAGNVVTTQLTASSAIVTDVFSTVANITVVNASSVVTSSVNASVANSTIVTSTGYQINGAAPLNYLLVGDGTKYTSASIIPTSAASYQQFTENYGAPLPRHGTLNILSPLIATDDSANSSTTIGCSPSGAIAGSYNYPSIVVDAFGRITSASNQGIYYQTVEDNGSGLTPQPILNITSPLTAVNGAGSTTVGLAPTGVAGTYTAPKLTLDNFGRVISASNIAIYYETIAANYSNITPPRQTLNFLYGNLVVSDNPTFGTTDVGLATTPVIPGTYAYANVTVDPYGRITNAQTNSAIFNLQSKLTPNGYQYLPGGTILQWMSNFVGEGSQGGELTASFPVAFPTACLFVSINSYAGYNASDFGEMPVFTVTSWNTASVQFYWQRNADHGGNNPTALIFAIGH